MVAWNGYISPNKIPIWGDTLETIKKILGDDYKFDDYHYDIYEYLNNLSLLPVVCFYIGANTLAKIGVKEEVACKIVEWDIYLKFDNMFHNKIWYMKFLEDNGLLKVRFAVNNLNFTIWTSEYLGKKHVHEPYNIMYPLMIIDDRIQDSLFNIKLRSLKGIYSNYLEWRVEHG